MVLGKCGNDCGKCQLHVSNLITHDDKVRTAKGMSIYLRWNPTPEKLRSCEGCQSTKPNSFLYIPGCRVRKCAILNNLDTCAQCDHFPCEEVPKVSEKTDFRDRVETRLGSTVPEEDYQKFIEPYEGMKHLEEQRETITKVVKIKTYDYRPRMKPIPDNLDESYHRLHKMIGDFYTIQDVPDVIITVLKEKRRELVKLLYSLGVHGTYTDGVVTLSSETYRSLKLPSEHYKMEEKLAKFREANLDARLVTYTEDYATPKGGLRTKGWRIEVRGDKSLIKALLEYTGTLNSEYGKGGFRYFSNGNMKSLVTSES
jgi:hypothetical protein